VGKKTSITVTRIKCNKASEAGHDEIFVTFQADGGFRTRLPRLVGRQSMATGDSWDINHTAEFHNDLQVMLFESDSLHIVNIDYLGSFAFTPLDVPSEVAIIKPDDAQYTLYVTRNA